MSTHEFNSAIPYHDRPASRYGMVHEQQCLLRVFRIGVEVVVLACTELPMIPVAELCKQEDRTPPKALTVDPAVLLAEELLNCAARPVP